MDNELFNLCKEVYEKTGWKDTEKVYTNQVNEYADVKDTFEVVYNDDMFSSGEYGDYGSVLAAPTAFKDYIGEPYDGMEVYPLYTSDYLLEKLPPVIFGNTSDNKNVPMILTLWINGDKTAHAAYLIPFDEQNRGSHAQTSKTPLKALLKLVIALSESGELK